MILRKLAAAIRRQDWFTVVLEVVIVVVGIFIGLQVDDWNEQRKESLKQEELLVDLSGGLRSDLQELDGTIALQARRYAAFSLLLDKAIGWEDRPYRYDAAGQRIARALPPVDKSMPADEAMTVIQQFRTFDPSRHAYDGMVAVGDILLLEDEELVRALQAHYLLVESINEVEDIIYMLTWEKIRDQLMNNGVGLNPRLTWDEAVSIVRGDEALIGALKAGAFEAAEQMQFLSLIRNRTDELLAKFDAQH